MQAPLTEVPNVDDQKNIVMAKKNILNVDDDHNSNCGAVEPGVCKDISGCTYKYLDYFTSEPVE